MNRITNLLIMITCISMLLFMLLVSSLFVTILYIEWKQNENIKRLVHEYIFSVNDCKKD
jgi:4-hydroxybenzoate polyprenyltransferase